MFHKGQHSGADDRRTKRVKKLTALFASLVLVLLVAVGTTLAYIYTHTPDVENTFAPGRVDVEIDEEFDKTEKKDVHFQNTGDTAVYVRAKLVINWVDGDNAIVLQVPDGYACTIDGAAPAEWTPTAASGWVEGDDGYYYYTEPVAPGAATGNLFDLCTATTAADPQYHLLVDVLTEVVQAQPPQAVVDTWGVTVAEDGTVIM